MKGEQRIYPTSCQSMFCGKGPSECPNCENYTRLKDFEKWEKDTNAIVRDPIWSPTVYTATK